MLALVFGVAGYVIELCNFSVVPIVPVLMLGPTAEAGLSQALPPDKNSLALVSVLLFSSPICVVLMLLMAVSALRPSPAERRSARGA